MIISAIYAKDLNGVIGNGSKLPWPFNKDDMRFFQQNTLGKPVIVGRKTFETFPQPLYGRVVIVVSRSYDEKIEPEYFRNADQTKICVVERVSSIEDAISLAHSYFNMEEIFRRKIDVALEKEVLDPNSPTLEFKETVIIGGAEIYRQSIKLVDRVYETEIHGEYEGDVFIPEEVTTFVENNMHTVHCRETQPLSEETVKLTFNIYGLNREEG